MADLHMTHTPDMPTRQTCGAWLALRREIIELQDLKRKVQVRADGAGSVGPEGRGKRSHKGKVGVANTASLGSTLVLPCNQQCMTAGVLMVVLFSASCPPTFDTSARFRHLRSRLE